METLCPFNITTLDVYTTLTPLEDSKDSIREGK